MLVTIWSCATSWDYSPPLGGRDLVTSLLGALSARDGRMIAISVLGDFEVARELVARRHDPDVVVHLHQAPADARLDDESAWRAANPALGSIKSPEYMRDMSRRAAASPAEQRSFAVFELNLPGRPDVQIIVALGHRAAQRGDELRPIAYANEALRYPAARSCALRSCTASMACACAGVVQRRRRARAMRSSAVSSSRKVG